MHWLVVRIPLTAKGTPAAHGLRVLLLAAAALGVAGLLQTAELSGRLVYEQGVGVIGAGLR